MKRVVVVYTEGRWRMVRLYLYGKSPSNFARNVASAHESRFKASRLLRTVAEYDCVDRRLVSGGVLSVHELSVDTFVQNWQFFLRRDSYIIA